MPVPTADSSMRSPAPASIAARRARAGGPGRTASRTFRRRMRPSALASAPAAGAIRAQNDRCPSRRSIARASGSRRIPTCVRRCSRLARVAGVSPWHLQRTFKRLLGVTPAEYAQARRAARLKHELKHGPVTDAIYAAGFGSPSRVYDEATGVLGMTPRAYRAGGRGERIRFTTLTTRLGVMLVAATDRGLCRVALGDDPRRARAAAPGRVSRRRRAPGPRGPGSRGVCAARGCRRPAHRQRAGARRARDGVSAPGLARAAGDSCRRDADLRRDRPTDWAPTVGPGRRKSLRHQSGRARRALPPRRAVGRRNRRVPLGERKKEEAPGG